MPAWFFIYLFIYYYYYYYYYYYFSDYVKMHEVYTVGWRNFFFMCTICVNFIGTKKTKKNEGGWSITCYYYYYYYFNVISYIVMSQILVAMFGCWLSLHITNIIFYYCCQIGQIWCRQKKVDKQWSVHLFSRKYTAKKMGLLLVMEWEKRL